MARVTVEDCIDKIPNRFELVLGAAHRARMLTKGSAITVEPENDKNAVIALREVAERTLAPADLREWVIHAMQQNVEIDEPEMVAGPVVPREQHLSFGRGEQSGDAVVDTLTEEQLLRAMQNLSPVTESEKGSGSGSS